MHLAVVLGGYIEGTNEGKIPCSCFFAVVGGKPCAVNWSLLNRASPSNFSDHVCSIAKKEPKVEYRFLHL
jgi:hypothetical protein